MGTFKKITESTELESGMLIREFNTETEDFDDYILGNYIQDKDAYEVLPEGKDFLDKEGVLFYYPQSKMITRGCEFYED